VLSLCIIRFTTKHFILPPNKSTFHGWSSTKMAQDGLEEYILTDLLLVKYFIQNVKSNSRTRMTIHEDGKPLSKNVDLKKKFKTNLK
jgi:hypothetical protein